MVLLYLCDNVWRQLSLRFWRTVSAVRIFIIEKGEKKKMKKVISLLLSIVMLTGVLSLNANVFAAGWLEKAVSVEFDTHYTLNVDANNPDSNNFAYGWNIGLKISVPTKGNIDYYAECSSKSVLPTHIVVYKSNNLNNKVMDLDAEPQYNSAYGTYSINHNFILNAGEYYILLEIYDYRDDVRDGESDGSFDTIIGYKPSFSNTSISKVTAKKKAFNVKWKKASGVTGYEIQYSTKKNMKNAKKVKIKKASSTSKTIKKLKAKKKYYVRIRTYKTVNINSKNKTYYGKWSGKKTVKTKK